MQPEAKDNNLVSNLTAAKIPLGKDNMAGYAIIEFSQL